MALFDVNKPLTAETTVLSTLDLNAAPHALTFNNFKQTLTVANGEAVPLTINLLGDGVTTYTCPTYGDINVSAGKDVVVAAGATEVINLPSIAAYLGASANNVAVTVTGSTAPSLAEAWVSEY
jgi:hypothetical protein